MTNDTRQPTHRALVITNPNRRRDEKPWFEPIGAAWPTQDGKGYFVKLYATPVNGEFLLKEPRDEEEQPDTRQQDNRDDTRNGYNQQSRGR